MIYPQPFIFFGSIGLVLAISSIIFVWRFNSIKEKIKSSKILILLSKIVDKNRVKVLEDMLSKNSNFFFMTIQPSLDGINFNAPKMKDISKIIFLFDVSKNTIPIEEQLKEFENIKSFCEGKSREVIAIYSNEMDEEKIRKLEEIFGRIFILNENLLEKELLDIQRLINSLSFKEPIKTLT
jgi:hypothetical protein